MFLDTFLALLGLNKITNGVIVKKNHYGPVGVSVPNAEIVGYKTVLNPDTVSSEGWSFTVRGKGRFGSIVTQEIYVDSLTWNTTEVGTKWPITSTT